jgi:2Fe-2S ferredoxin
MPTVHFIHPNGQTTSLEVDVGKNVMSTCRDHDFSEVLAECGGSALCATCHVYIDEAQVDVFSLPNEVENQMLEFVASERRPTSRLSCQLTINEQCNNLKIYFPLQQI